MRALVIGYGSIGQRHYRILSELGWTVSVVSERSDIGVPVFQSVTAALATDLPQYCVIANATSRHESALESLTALGFCGTVLVEKPLAVPREAVERTRAKVYVGYNLRFHPLIQRIRELLAGSPAAVVDWHVGQYLPDWRPSRDYRSTYSASASQGGGVVNDLSHELDLLLWLFGPAVQLVATIARSNTLAIDVEDTANLLMSCERCPQVSLHMNYLDRRPVRQFVITTQNETFVGDLVHGTLTSCTGTEKFEVARDLTYRMEHRAVADASYGTLCSVSEALRVDHLITCAIESNRTERWIHIS